MILFQLYYNLVADDGFVDTPIECYKHYTVGKLKELLSEELNCGVRQIKLQAATNILYEMYNHIEVCEYLDDGDRFYVVLEEI